MTGMNEIEKAIGDLKCIRNCYSGYPRQKALDLAISALEAQQADRWIPVTKETNPKESDIYLVTFEENGKRYVERFYYSEFSGWMMPVKWQDKGRIDKMIAWKPLPEPYKEEQP